MPQDDVESIVAAWSRERPELDFGSIALTSRVLRLAHHFETAQQEHLASLDLKPGWLDVLAALRRSGPPYRLSASELASSTLVSSGGMTSRIDRLEEAGFVSRAPDPADRRGVLVELIGPGRRVVDAAVEAQQELGERLLRPLAPDERQAFTHLMRKLLIAFEHPEATPEEPEVPSEEAPSEVELTASWIPRAAGRASPRGSALRDRRPRAGRRAPSR
jgi:DNA-binding MarR family transcriptional regulator